MKKILLAMLTILMILSACSKQTSLVGTKWQLVNYDVNTIALEGVTVTLNFDKDSIGGTDGCNSYGGSYTAGETTIKFSDTFSTEMYCTDEIMTQATTYYTLLSQVTSYVVDGQLLTLFNSDGKKLAEFIPFEE